MFEHSNGYTGNFKYFFPDFIPFYSNFFTKKAADIIGMRSKILIYKINLKKF